MKLFFKDENGNLRVVDTEGVEVDLSEQKAVRNWIEEGTSIRVKSPVLACYSRQPLEAEPMVA